jgi:hypothetical protein
MSRRKTKRTLYLLFWLGGAAIIIVLLAVYGPEALAPLPGILHRWLAPLSK